MRHSRLINQAVGGAFAVLLPFTMVYTFSAKYDIARYYPKMVRNVVMLGGVGVLWYKTR